MYILFGHLVDRERQRERGTAAAAISHGCCRSAIRAAAAVSLDMSLTSLLRTTHSHASVDNHNETETAYKAMLSLHKGLCAGESVGSGLA